MPGEREQQAVMRINAALQRIEAVAARPVATAPSPGAALRAEVSEALHDLDRLIRELEQ